LGFFGFVGLFWVVFLGFWPFLEVAVVH
jgi:hypothetical protein